MAAGQDPQGTMLLVEEYFDGEDPRFVETLRNAFIAPQLASLVERWKKDTRPWARAQMLAYLAQPLNVPGHHVVVKRLFKQAEANADHELMAAFLVAFDRLIRHVRKKRYRYEWIRETRQSLTHETEYLANPRDSILPPNPRPKRNPRNGEPIHVRPPRPVFIPYMRLFSPPTRRYLRRRAWRYFRRLGFQQPALYVPAVTHALLLYTDADVQKPENLLDNWGLMQACFGRQAIFDFAPSGVKLKDGCSLAELNASPYHAALWSVAEASPLLLMLLIEARSRPVRLWARQLLERDHRPVLNTLPVETILRLLDHEDAELQQFGASLLGSLAGIESWPVATWLRLLEVKDPTAVALVCEQMQRQVKAERLDPVQCLELATAAAAPVARLGLQCLAAKKWAIPEERRALSAIGSARSAAVGGDLARWALSIVGSPTTYDREVVSALFDSLLEPVRQAARVWLESSTVGQDDPLLWGRLLETPFDDLRLKIVDLLSQRSLRPAVGSHDLAPLWTAVLLGVHRGGRQKLKAVQQLAEALVRRPEAAPMLLSVLGVAVRSVRRPEQRGALAAVALLLDRRPEMAALIEQCLPELSLTASSLPTSSLPAPSSR